jgi:hypothetical protein
MPRRKVTAIKRPKNADEEFEHLLRRAAKLKAKPSGMGKKTSAA